MQPRWDGALVPRMTRRWTILAALFGLALSACGGTEADVDTADEAVEHPAAWVSTGVYRGSRPDDAQMRRVKSLGVRAVLNLENSSSAISRDRALAQKYGLKFISEPMDGFAYPNDAQVNRIVAYLKQRPDGYVFVHCHHGEDRTGLIIALHRIFNQGWTVKRARQEMLDKGFHRSLFLLYQYFKDKTGYDD